MSLQDLGSLGEFLSSIGVIVTLVYLIVEIRRNTAAARETSLQRVFDRFSNTRMMITSNPQLAEALDKMENDEDLSRSEIRQVRSYLTEFGFALLYYFEDFSSDDDSDTKGNVESSFNHFAAMLNNRVGRDYILKQRPFPKWLNDLLREKVRSLEADV